MFFFFHFEFNSVDNAIIESKICTDFNIFIFFPHSLIFIFSHIYICIYMITISKKMDKSDTNKM